MNPHKDYLHSTIVNILNKQDLERKKSKAQFEAALFSFYYAQGGAISAAEQQKGAKTNYALTDQSLTQNVAAHYLSTNVLALADQVKVEVNQSMSTTAMAAANVQIAANAILRLASDIGSVFSILHAADLDVELNIQAEECSALMNETAYLAELTSQHAMEASELIAEISANNLDANAKKTEASMQNLLTIVSEEFAAEKTVLETNTEKLDDCTTVENKTKGEYKSAGSNYLAADDAYQLSNEKSNLNLRTEDLSCTGFSIAFDFIKSPFENQELFQGFVKSYNVLLVKEREKSTFSIANAEQLILEKGRYIEVVPSENDGKESVSKTILVKDLIDSDGDPMQLGEAYVVFVLAVYSDEYKKTINSFNDYLSAPSLPFGLSYTLESPEAELIKLDAKTNMLRFSLSENTDFKVAYRCIYLPCNSKEEDLQPGFVFNLAIAEQIETGNYTVAQVTEEKLEDGKALINGTTQITEATTDNFGNPLVEGQMYVPVVLSFSTEVATQKNQFTNSLSLFPLTSPFIYHPIELEQQ